MKRTSPTSTEEAGRRSRPGRRLAGALVALALTLVAVVAAGASATATVGLAAPAPGPAGAADDLASPGGRPADLTQPSGDAADPEAVRQKAKEIVDQPEYRPPPETITQRLGRELSKQLGKLAGGGPGSAAGWAVMALLVGLILFIVFKVGRTVQRDPAQPAVEVSVEVQRSPTEWRAEAERFEQAGNWKEALRCRYRALVADLVADEVVPDIPGRTVGEQRQDVFVHVPEAAPDFSGAAELFEEAWYGDRSTGPEENQRFRALADQVRQKAAR